jgi:cell division protein FtsI (penicillin-binding protein 3)
MLWKGRSPTDKRLTGFLVFAALVVVLLVGRLVYLTVVVPSAAQDSPVDVPTVERGPILDRNGRILAITTALDSVAAWVPHVRDAETESRLLAEALEMEPRAVAERLSSGTGFVWIKRKVTPTEGGKVRAMIADGRLPGVTLHKEYGRSYPERQLASHLVGYVGVDNTGLDGIEWSFDHELSPPQVGKGMREIYGNQVFLTIDLNIQYFVEQITERAWRDTRADSAMVLVMDARGGEILAYANLPSFDPNNYHDARDEALINRPVRVAYEPGSVFKIFTISSLLQLGAITPQDTFYAGGVYEDPRYGIRIRDLGVYGLVNAQKILQYSSNVGAAYASERASAPDFYEMLRKFGFGKPTGVPLAGETSGILRPPSEWSARSKATIAFGQEISVSALQIVGAATVLANDGLMLKPQLVSKIVSPEGKLIKRYGREPVNEVLSPEVARSVIDMMETATFEGGTARRARLEGLRVSAKTGTAEVRDPATGTYSDETFIASFIGIFPTDNPQFIVYVVLDGPKKEIFGSRTAAPVFKEVADKLVALRGLPRAGTEIVRHPGTVVVKPGAPITVGEAMPDLAGSPKRALLGLFERQDLKILMRGEGFVVRQSPAPGTRVSTGMTITLDFE